MSQENVDLVRKGNAAFRSRDWDTMAAFMDPDILIRTDARWPEQRIYGRESALAWYRELWEAGGPDSYTEELLDLGDRVLARWCWHMRGPRSGVEVEQRGSVIYTLRERRVILEEFFLDHAQALKAVGLEA